MYISFSTYVQAVGNKDGYYKKIADFENVSDEEAFSLIKIFKRCWRDENEQSNINAIEKIVIHPNGV